MKLFAHVGGTRHELELEPERDALRTLIDGAEVIVTLDDRRGPVRSAFVGGRRIEFAWRRVDGRYLIQIDGIEHEVEIRDARAERAAQVRRAATVASGETTVRAPIPGRVVKVLVAAGDRVAREQPLLTLDAMKLENEIPSPREGVIKSIDIAPGAAVEKGQPLIVIG